MCTLSLSGVGLTYIVKVPELPGSKPPPLLFSICHQLTSARHHRPQHPRVPVSLRICPPLHNTLDGA